MKEGARRGGLADVVRRERRAVHAAQHQHPAWLGEPDRLARARTVLTVADAFNYLLSGVGKIEVSMASTTQLYNPRLAKWSERRLVPDFPRSIFPEVAQPATTLGPLKPSLAEESGLANVNVVAYFRMTPPVPWRRVPLRAIGGRTSVPAHGRSWDWNFRSLSSPMLVAS